MSIASSKVNPYRMVIVVRLVVLAFFLRYRILHPVPDAIGLWLVSIICEIWFAISWILDQFPKWFPIDRETYLDRLSLRSVSQSRLTSSIRRELLICRSIRSQHGSSDWRSSSSAAGTRGKGSRRCCRRWTCS